MVEHITVCQLHQAAKSFHNMIVLASMQTPCSHLLRVTHECIVCSLRSSFLNVGMQLICLKDLESEAPVLNSEFCIRGLEGRLTFFFGHLLAEIFEQFPCARFERVG